MMKNTNRYRRREQQHPNVIKVALLFDNFRWPQRRDSNKPKQKEKKNSTK